MRVLFYFQYMERRSLYWYDTLYLFFFLQTGAFGVKQSLTFHM